MGKDKPDFETQLKDLWQADPSVIDKFAQDENKFIKNPITGRIISKYGFKWIQIMTVVDDLKKSNYIQQAIDSKLISPKKQPLKIDSPSASTEAVLKFGETTIKIQSKNVEELGMIFSNLDLSNESNLSILKSLSSSSTSTSEPNKKRRLVD